MAAYGISLVVEHNIDQLTGYLDNGGDTIYYGYVATMILEPWR